MALFDFTRRRHLRQARKGLKQFFALSVKDVMTDYVVTISPEKSVIDAANIMIGEDVSALVVEKDGKPLGILTERDFITKVPVSEKVFDMKVQGIMSCSSGKRSDCVRSVEPETTIAEARRIMQEESIRKLVVLDKEGLIAGIVTQTDLSRALYEQLPVVARLEKRPFLVEEVMSRKVAAVQRQADFKDAKKVMMKENVSALPIKDGDEFVGIFTEYDVVMQFYDAGGKLDIKRLPEIMKSPLKVVPAGLNIFDANMIMLFEKVRRLMAVKEGKVVGIITQTDLVHSCFDYAERMRDYLEKQAGALSAEDLLEMRRKTSIISEYAGEHLRSYTVK